MMLFRGNLHEKLFQTGGVQSHFTHRPAARQQQLANRFTQILIVMGCHRRPAPALNGGRLHLIDAMKLTKAAKLVRDGIHETLSYYHYPQEHWRRIRTNNPLERIMKEIRRRTRIVGSFPDGESALILVAARLRHIAGTKWGTRKYLDISLIAQAKEDAKAVG